MTALAGPSAGPDAVPGQAQALAALAATYARHAPVRSVAVLGNKPMGVDEERAAAVDACDLVVRVNGFVVDAPGAPPRYGTRTDVVVFTRGTRATADVFAEYSRRLYLLVEPGRMHWEPSVVPRWWPADLGMVHLSNREVTLPLSAELGLDSRSQAVWATTGTMAAWWAHTTFPAADLHLAGYSFVDDPTQTSWQHASGDSCGLSPEHQLAREGALLQRWSEDGTARFWR